MPEVIYSLAGKRVYVAGHRGMVGSAIVRRLASEGCEILTASSAEVDLRRQDQVEAWMSKHRPDAVFLAAARVGGILANATYPADFLYDNLILQANVIHAAHRAQVEKLMFLGSSCIYPKFADQPIVEDSLLTGSLEPTNEWYAIAKIAGLKLCQAYRKQHGRDFISAMPTNLYGQATISTSGQAMSCRRLYARHMRPKSASSKRYASGVPARRGANSCMLTIAPTPASIS